VFIYLHQITTIKTKIMSHTISIKLGKTVNTFKIERTIAGIVVTNQETSGIILELNDWHGRWSRTFGVREISFFEDELVEIAIKCIKKNKL
jgi:hypothetical protein